MSKKTNGSSAPNATITSHLLPVPQLVPKPSVPNRAAVPGVDVIRTLADLEKIGELFSKARLFKDVYGPEQACTKILVGRCFNFNAATSMMRIFFTDGKPSLDGIGMLLVLHEHGWDVVPVERKINGAKIRLKKPDGSLTDEVSFTEEDAQRAELLDLDTQTRKLKRDNWRKYPRSMYYWRAVAEACRVYAYFIFGGFCPYTPEELGAETDEHGTPLAIPMQSDPVDSTSWSAPLQPDRVVDDTPKDDPMPTVIARDENGIADFRPPTKEQLSRPDFIADIKSKEQVQESLDLCKRKFEQLDNGDDWFDCILDRFAPKTLDNKSRRSLGDMRCAVIVMERWIEDNKQLWEDPAEETATNDDEVPPSAS